MNAIELEHHFRTIYHSLADGNMPRALVAFLEFGEYLAAEFDNGSIEFIQKQLNVYKPNFSQIRLPPMPICAIASEAKSDLLESCVNNQKTNEIVILNNLSKGIYSFAHLFPEGKVDRALQKINIDKKTGFIEQAKKFLQTDVLPYTPARQSFNEKIRDVKTLARSLDGKAQQSADKLATDLMVYGNNYFSNPKKNTSNYHALRICCRQALQKADKVIAVQQPSRWKAIVLNTTIAIAGIATCGISFGVLALNHYYETGKWRIFQPVPKPERRSEIKKAVQAIIGLNPQLKK